MQKLVKATLCLGVVSVSLIACEFDSAVEKNVIDLDQLDNIILEADSLVEDSVISIDTIEVKEEDVKEVE